MNSHNQSQHKSEGESVTRVDQLRYDKAQKKLDTHLPRAFPAGIRLKKLIAKLKGSPVKKLPARQTVFERLRKWPPDSPSLVKLYHLLNLTALVYSPSSTDSRLLPRWRHWTSWHSPKVCGGPCQSVWGDAYYPKSKDEQTSLLVSHCNRWGTESV